MIDIIYRFVPEFRREQPAPADSEEARHKLEAGNRAFAELLTAAPGGKAAEPRIIPFDLRELRIAEDAGEAPAQAPFALVLGCSDARVPTELIFSQACNDLFVVRQRFCSMRRWRPSRYRARCPEKLRPAAAWRTASMTW
jgi:carbonic anhydrase